jgi:uncharacterized LabA/DUF88 family protein
MAPTNGKLAVLIDADNAQAAVIAELMAEIARYGNATVKRAYGDWTGSHLRDWKAVLPAMAIQPMQQFSYTNGKNSTDSALIIDAMDLLHSGKLNGICLVSSASDFTRLANRLREAGLRVYGFGEKKTPAPFVAACDRFIYTEILKPEPAPAAQDENTLAPLRPMLTSVVRATARESGWSALAAIGSLLLKNSPSFDSRNYGYPKLRELVREQPYLEVKEVTGEGSASVHVHVRLKP